MSNIPKNINVKLYLYGGTEPTPLKEGWGMGGKQVMSRETGRGDRKSWLTKNLYVYIYKIYIGNC